MNILFRNKGIIDPRSITTFGVSSKENGNAIGFFGTGLKYAIAILLRNGCSIEIRTGGQRLVFETRTETVRVDEFTFVTMNGERLGFTTELGKTWEMWQALRELWCNCLDENGEAFASDEIPDIGDDETLIIASGRPMVQAWDHRSTVMLDSRPIASNHWADIHPGASRFVYYRGIRVLDLGRPALFTYNIQTSMDLTEDRTIKHEFLAASWIARAIALCDNKHVIDQAVKADREHYEHNLDFSSSDPSPEFKGVVRLAARQFSSTLNRSAMECCRLDILEHLDNAEMMDLSKVDRTRLDRAIAFCRAIGFPVDEYPIIASEFLGEEILGRAHNETIYVSKRVFMMGTKMLAGTLIEEFIHLRHLHQDCTRGMQNFLFDTLVSLGEQITGEPI